jgi:hypothetical protein
VPQAASQNRGKVADKEVPSPPEGSDKTSTTAATIIKVQEEIKKEVPKVEEKLSGLVKPPAKPQLRYRPMPHLTASTSYLKFKPKVYPEQLNFDWNESDYMVTSAARKELAKLNKPTQLLSEK